MRLPGIRQLFSGNEESSQDTDIVMLITPHIVRSHELRPEDVGAIYIGTQANVGLSGPPQLIAPMPEAAPAPGGATQPPATGSGTAGLPYPPQPGVQGPPVASPPGTQGATPAAPPGTSPVPGSIPPPPPGTPLPPLTQPLPGPPAAAATAGTGTQPVIPPVTPVTPAGTPAPAAGAPTPRDPSAPPPAPSTGTPVSTATQLIVTPPGEFRVAGGPYTVPISINNASRLSAITLTITFNPATSRACTCRRARSCARAVTTAAFTP